MRGHNNSIVTYVVDLMDQSDRIFMERLTDEIMVVQTAMLNIKLVSSLLNYFIKLFRSSIQSLCN